MAPAATTTAGAGGPRAARRRRVDVLDGLHVTDRPGPPQRRDVGVGHEAERGLGEQRFDDAAVAVEFRAAPEEEPRAALGERHDADTVPVHRGVLGDRPPGRAETVLVAAHAGRHAHDRVTGGDREEPLGAGVEGLQLGVRHRPAVPLVEARALREVLRQRSAARRRSSSW